MKEAMRDFLEAVVFPFAIVMGILFMICALILVIGFIPSIVEVKIFNEYYGTNYTTWQWMCSSATIKDYCNKEGSKRTIKIGGDYDEYRLENTGQ